MDVEIPESQLQYLNGPARDELSSCTETFATDLLAEAGRLEAGLRSTTGDPEITSSIVDDANTLVRRGYVRPRRPWWIAMMQLLSYLAAIGAGAGVTALDKPVGQAAFAISTVVGVVCVAVVELRN